MKAMQLNQYSNLFRDKAAYQEFVRLLGESLEDDELHIVLSDSDVVCTVMGTETVKEIMQHRILKRFAEQPDLLDELRDRLQDTDLVD